MNKVIDFKALEVKGSDWYKKDGFAGSHLVTDRPSNAELGIENIRLTPPKGAHARVKANVSIRFDNGLAVFGTVFGAKNGTDLTFGVDQRKYEDNGRTGYADINVSVPMTIQAQVLRFADSLLIDAPVEKKAVTTPDKAVVEAVDTVAPKVEDMGGLDLNTLSKEDILAMLSKM